MIIARAADELDGFFWYCMEMLQKQVLFRERLRLDYPFPRHHRIRQLKPVVALQRKYRR